MFGKKIKTYGDLVKVIEELNIQDREIILSCEGYNSYCYETSGGSFGFKENDFVNLLNYNGVVVLCDNTGIDKEEIDKSERVKGVVCRFLQWFLEEPARELYGDYVTYDSIDDFLDIFLEDGTNCYDERTYHDVLTCLVNDHIKELQQRLDKKDYKVF